MGDAQSAQREGMKDEAGEEESGKVDDAQAEQSPEDKPFKNNGQISEISEKAGSSIAKVNDHCEDEIATDAVLTPDEEVSETENPLEVEEETPSKHIEKNEIESSNEADVAEDVPLDMIEMDAKTNDINDGFRRFFSNIGLRLSIKRGSTDLLRDLPDETNQDEPSGQENLEDSAEEIPIEDAEQNTDVNIAQVSTDNDSTTCPTMTDVTPEDVLENAEEKATEAKEDVESDNADSITSPAVEDTQQDTTPEEEPNSLSPPEQADVVSPIKRFFTTGIFSGLRKKRKAVEDDVNEKEMVDMGKNEAVELVEETEYDQQEDKEQIDRGVEAAVVDTEVKENELKQEILSVTSAKKADEGKSPTTDHSTAIDTTTIFPESETPNSQEKDKVQASPLKRLLSGSSFKKLSKKPRSRRSSDAKLSDSGEHAADQLLSSTESTENQKEEKSTQPSPEAAGQEDGAWVSFKKLLTPKKHTRTPSLSNKETEIPDSGEEPKPSDGEQISDHSTEEGKKRKDSSVSWEAVLCGSGKKRSRKTSDSEDESPQIDDNKQDIGSKNGAELPEESANEKKNDVSVSSPKQSPLIGDGGSTWKSFKRLVTPKRKAKDEDESKDNIQSDSEVSQDESSFSIKKLLPGRKKRKSAEKQDHISSDEADKDVPSDDEDSETPAVVPMSEFDTPESVIQIQTQVDIESHFPKEVPQDLVQQMPKQILSCDSLQNEAKKLKENGDAVDNGTSTIPAKIEQLDDVSEIISKHQQLSDITEEGMITETMATPVSINEEVGRDDTLAEDLLEITSEAITAPEPASVTTLADETEMISAVSQLSSESSKTSGNTTPVPAEYEVKETEELLHQVVENISTSPMAVPISSTTPKSESIVGSVLHHIFRTFVKEDKETTILEIHRKSDATAINTGQTAEELDAVNEVRATAQTESISEVNDSDPKEFLPDVREKLDTAEITKDEVHEDHPIDPEQSLKELERINEIENDSHHQDESQLDANAAGSVVESLQAEMETPKMGTEDPPKEFKEETELPREVKVEPEKVDESYTDACKTEYVQLPDAIKGVQATVLDSEDGSIQSLEREVPLEEVPVAEVTDELKEETLPLTSVNLETVDTSKTDLVQEPHVLHTLQASSLDSMADDGLSLEKLPEVEMDTVEPKHETEVTAEPEGKLLVKAAETDVEDTVKDTKTEVACIDTHVVTESTDEGSTTTSHTEGSLESVDSSKTVHVQEPEVQGTLFGLLMRSLLPHKKVSSDDVSQKLTITDEPQPKTEVGDEPEQKLPDEVLTAEHVQEPEGLPSEEENSLKETKTEEGILMDKHEVTGSIDEDSATLPICDDKIEQVDASETQKEPQELQMLQPAILDLKTGGLLSLEQKISEDFSAVETVTEKPRQETEVRVGSEEKLLVKAAKTDDVQESQVLPSDVEDTIRDTSTDGGESMDVPVVTESIEECATILLNEESIEPANPPTTVQVLPFDGENTVKETSIEGGTSIHVPEVIESTEGGDEKILLTKKSDKPMDLSTTEQVKAQVEAQTSPLDSEVGNLLPFEKVISEDITAVETVTEEPRKETVMWVEAVTTEYVQLPEPLTSDVKEPVEETSIEEGASIQVPVVTESTEVGHKTVPLTKGSPESMEASKTEHVQEQEDLSLHLKVDSLLPPEKVISELIPAIETITEQPRKAAEVSDETEEKQTVGITKTESVVETEVLSSNIEDSVKDTKTEEGASTDMQVVTECTEEGTETIPHTEGSLEPEDPPKTDHVEELEESLLGKLMHSLLPDNKELSDDLLQKETVTDEPQPATEVREEPEENVPLEAERIPEPEVITTVQEAQFDSRASSQSHEKVILEDITAVETVRDKPQKETELRVEPEEKLQVKGAKTDDIQEPQVLPSDVEDSVKGIQTEEGASTGMQVVTECTEEGTETIPHTEGSLEPEDPPKTDHVEEPEESKTVQESLLGQLMHILLPQKNVLSDDLSQKETVTDEPQPATEMRDESKENVPVEAERIPEPKVITTVQEAQLDSMTTNLSLKKVIFEDITALETFRDEPHNETELSVEPVEKLQAKGAKTDDIQELEVLPSDVEDYVKDIKTEEGASTGMQVVTECTEEGTETIPHTEGSLEPEDPPKTDHVEELEESQTAQESLLGKLMRSPLPDNKELSDDLLQKETGTDEPQPATEVREEPEENVPVEAEHIPEPEVITTVQEAQFDSRASSQSHEKVILEDITAVETVRDKPQNETELRVEPEEKLQVKGAKTDDIQEPQVLPSDVEDSVKGIQTEEGASTGMQVVTECTEEGTETIPHTEGSLEPEDPPKTDHVEEPEESKTVQESLLGQLMHILLPQKNVLSDDLSQKETVTDEPQPATEMRDESKENVPVEAERIPEPKVITTVQEAQLDSMTTNLSLKKVIFEDITALETFRDEPHNETELSVEPVEKLQAKGAKTDDIQELEVLPSDVEDYVKDIKTEEGASTGMQVVTECTEEGTETIPHTEGSLEPEDPSKTDHVEEPEESKTVQESLLGQLMHIPLSQKKVFSDDLLQKETVTDETQPETEVIDKSEENVPVEAEHIPEPEVITTVQEAQFDSRASSQSHEKVILKNITAVETVRDEPQKETGFRFEPEEKLQVKDAKTDNVQESEVLPSSLEDTVKKTEIEEDASVHVPETTESIEGGDAAISVTEGSPESMDPSTAEQVKAQEESQTVQASPLDSDIGSLLPSEKVITEDIPAVQVPDLLTSDVKNTVMETLIEQGPSIPMPVVTESAEVESATVLLSEGSFESVDTSTTEHVQGPAILQTDQESPFESKAGSLFPPKKVTSEDILAIEIVTEDPQKDETERVQEPQVLQTAQGPAIDSNVADILHLKKVVSGDIPTNDQETEARVVIHGKKIVEDTDTECVMEPVVLPSDVEDTGKAASIDTNVVTGHTEEGTATIPHNEGSLEPVDPLKTDFAEEREVQESLLGCLMHSLLPHKKVSSDDLSPKETLTNEPQPRTEVRDEPEKNVPVEAVTTEYVQEPEVLPSDIEETEKETRTKEDALTDLHVITESTEGVKATLTIIEGALEPVHHSKTEWVQEPEQPSRLDSKAGSSLIEQILSEDITAVATFTDEHTLEAVVRVELEEEQSIEASKTEYVQEQEVLPSDAKDNVKEAKTEEHTSKYVHAVTETTVHKPDADNTIASVTDTIEREVVAQFDQAAEKSDGHKTEHIINASVFEQEDSIPEVAEELLATPQVHVSSVNEESTYVQVLESPLLPEEIQAPAVDNATNKDEFKHNVHLSAVQVSVEMEKESELSSTEINTAALEHAIVTQVVTCDLKEFSATIPDLLPEKKIGITEPLIDRVASQEVFGEANPAKPLVKDDSVTAEQHTVIQRMHVPSVEFEGNHKIQVQVVDVNLKSTGTIVDNKLEVGVTETKEVIDYCQETMKTVENPSATPDIETKITVQEVTQHVPEKVSESAVTILEQAVIKQPDALTAVSELAESESNQMGNQKVIKDSTGTLTEKDEKSVVISDDSATAQQVSEDLTHAPDLLFGLNVSIGSHREKLEQTKAKQAKSEAGVTVGEIKALSEEADVEEVNEPAQITQISQDPILTPSNTGLVVPQNTGIISSIGNVESPSSLSLEFKLNIQFGQAKAQTPSPPTEQIEPMKKTHVSDVGVQAVEAVEPVKPIIPTQRAESHNQIDLTEVKDITVTATNFVYTERALTTTQPDLLDVGINTIETVESITKGPASPPMPTDRIETVKQTDVFVVGVQAVESVETVKPFILTQSAGSEKQIESTVVNVAPKEIPGPDSLLVLTERDVLTTQPVLLDVAIHAIETEELVSKAKTFQSLPEIIDCSEPVKQMDVLEAGSQAIHALEPLSLRRIEATEVNDQPTEITKPAANLVLIERALFTTHPQLLEVGINSIKTVDPVATTPDSLPSTTDRTETEKETDVAVVGFQALKTTEPAKTVIPPEREIQKQIEPTEVNNQSTEMTEPATILESTKRAVITTYPELLGEVLPSDAEDTLKDTKNEEAASIDTHVVEESTKESATVPHIDDSLEPGDPSKTEHVQEPEVKESLLGLLMRSLLPHQKVLSEDFSQKETVANERQPKTEVRDEPEVLLGVGIHPTEAVELVEERTNQEPFEPTQVNIQPIEITQPVANLVETALITTQPELLDVGMHLIETVEPLAKASASPPPVMEINDPVKRMDVLEVEVQAIEAVLPTEINEIQKQIDLTEVSNQQIAIKEPGTLLGSTERAVMTQPELLDVGINTIQTVQPEATAPPSSQAITERIELGKQMNISEHGFQAEEAEEPVNTVLPAQRAESPKQVELAEVNVQQTETTEPEAQLFSNEKAVIMTHPVLLDLGIHAIETIEPDPNASATPQVTTDITEDLKDTNSSNVVIQVEEAVEYEMPINSTQRAESQEEPQLIETDAQATEVTETAVNVVIPAVITTPPVLLDNSIHPTTTVELVSNVQAKETMQPASQMDDREVFRGEPVQSEDCDQETKANVNNTEEENDQDVWMDAEEVVYNQEVAEKSSLEIEEPEEEMEAECVHEEEAKLEEVELASYSRTEEEESQQEVYNRGETCEIESEGEDFAIALEHQEYATASFTTLEWD